MINSVFIKLLKNHLAVILVTLAGLGLLLSYSFEGFYLDMKAKDFAAQASLIAHRVGPLLKSGNLDGVTNHLNESDYLVVGGKVWVVDNKGLIRTSSNRDRHLVGSRLGPREVGKVLSGHAVFHKGDFPYLKESVLSVGVPVKEKGRVIGAVFIYAPVAGVTARLGRVRGVILKASLIAVCLAMFFASTLSRHLVKRLRELNIAAFEMASGHFDRRIKAKAPDEIGDLAETFNFLMERLKASMEALRQEKDKRDYLLQSMSEGVIAIDRDARIILANPVARRLFKIEETPEEVQKVESEYPGGTPGWRRALERSLQTGERTSLEFRLDNGNVVMARVAPVTTGCGETIGSVGIFQDISERRKLEQIQRDFVANASHELKTPLTTIRGFAKMLLDKVVVSGKAQEKYLKIIVDECNRLARLTDQLLDLSKIDANRLELERRPVNAGEVVRRTVQTMASKFLEAHVALHVCTPGDAGFIMGDEERLEQVLLNLLTNALEFTPAGGEVFVETSCEPGRIILTVRDTGFGIPPEEIDRIWERFYRVHGVPSRSSSGTGLGLAIVKEIVKAHGGDVGVRSEPGKGSAFWVGLPALDMDLDHGKSL
ncbi:MAG: HAMP domain-containing protein [Firmicutes bacterium]|nr:HAMP domain-containing protein [Bacillota bacterium]